MSETRKESHIPNVTVYIRIRRDGKSEVLEARCWDKSTFLESYRVRSKAIGATVDEITEAEYKAEKNDAMVGVGAGRGPRLYHR